MTSQASGQLPHWDLSNVFPGLESESFVQAVAELKDKLDDLENYLTTRHIARTAEPPQHRQRGVERHHQRLPRPHERHAAAQPYARRLRRFVRVHRFLQHHRQAHRVRA